MVNPTSILEFLSRRPSAEAVTVNDYLKGRSLTQTRLLLHVMAGEGLVAINKRVVEGSRLAVFFRITTKGREKLQTDTFATTTHCCLNRELTVA